jgi:hypothetical protein
MMRAGGAHLATLALGPPTWIGYRAVRRRLHDDGATIGPLVALGSMNTALAVAAPKSRFSRDDGA